MNSREDGLVDDKVMLINVTSTSKESCTKQTISENKISRQVSNEGIPATTHLSPSFNPGDAGISSEKLNSATSSMATSISESLVDAEKAGIIGVGLYKQSMDQTSRPCHSYDNLLNEDASDKVKRQSIAFTDPGVSDFESRLGRNSSSYGKTIDKNHVNFVLMYDMLTGIRHSVSVCQAKMCRPLTSEDFLYARTYFFLLKTWCLPCFRYNFLQDSNSTTPSKYEFRFKDYCPWVFRSLREAFHIDAADYLVYFPLLHSS